MRERRKRATAADTDTSALKLAVGTYILIFALKLGAYFMTGVMALMAEALHTLSDILVSGFLLVAAIWSRKRADEVHMFGYGRAQNVAALVAATLFISFTSFKLYEESIPRLFKPSEATYQNLPLAVGVIIASMVIAAVPLITLFRQKQHGAAARAQFRELINDELGLTAALLGTLFIAWGQPLADPLASIVVATVIAWSAFRLFRENASFLLGRAPGPEFQKQVEQLVLATPGVLGMHDFRAEHVGPNAVHTGLHIEVRRGLPVEEADRIAEDVRERVEHATGCQYCVIHVDAAESSGASVRPLQMSRTSQP
ncbi:MAG TPA: cation diffusion facilitator family transporter [Ktedonobacterales bacterium]